MATEMIRRYRVDVTHSHCEAGVCHADDKLLYFDAWDEAAAHIQQALDTRPIGCVRDAIVDVEDFTAEEWEEILEPEST